GEAKRAAESILANRDIVVVGASAGGVEPLTKLVAGLPRDLPAAVFVVVHLPATTRSFLPNILSRAGALVAVHPEDGAPIRPGHVYVAPPNHHLLVEPGRMRLLAGPRVNRVRPAADPLFRSAARAYGERVTGGVLSGTQDDGAAGLAAIKERGGVAIVQDPADALFSGMPCSALERAPVDRCARAPELADVIMELVAQPLRTGTGGAEVTMAR